MNKKLIKAPLTLIIGLAIGYLLSSLFIFSDRVEKSEKIDEEIVPYKVFQPYIPDKLTFCGEEVPLEYFDVYEALDYEMVVNTYRHSGTIMYLKKAKRYFPEIEKMLKENGIPDDMKYLCVAESGLENVVSPAGATGFWQLMKTTGQQYGLTVNKYVDERYDHKKSLEVAILYLRDAYEKFGSWSLAAASYNMGMTGLNRNIEKQKADSYWDLSLNSETRRYVFRILALKLIMSNPQQYGFHIPNEDLYKEIETYEVTVDTTITDLVKFALDQGVNYKILKQFNPWLRSDDLINSERKSYTIVLPEKRTIDRKKSKK